ncbi:MAG: hypothetical protein JWP97_1342 [Labilithrix sp.]|nr:hypothetical protein [Labilithrix sp.]
MRSSSLGFTGLALSIGLTLGSLSACSSTSARATYEDDAGPVTEVPEQNGKPKDPPGEPPIETGGDAGADAAPPDTCARTAPSNACGLIAQCGCTLAQTCDIVDGKGGVGCVTAGLAAMGAACINTSGCARGLTCVFGTCHAFCDNAGSACTIAQTGGCEQVKDSTGASLPSFEVCRVACDLRSTTACGASGAAGTGVCMVDDAGNTDCIGVDGTVRAAGQSCGEAQECGPGTVCASTGSSGSTCHKWCKVGSADCGGTVQCVSFQTPVKVGPDTFGVCP